MAISIDAQNLVEYPGIVKRITADQESVVPIGFEGDEQYLLSFSTSAYSDNVARTRIQSYYITNFKAGWCKSSGFAGSMFALDDTHNSIEIRIDSTTSGISDGYYRITLDDDDGVPIAGDVVADDMETKIRALASTFGSADAGFALAYMNATVEFISGKFWIIAGSVSNFYSGANKSSVMVRASGADDCSALLGFDLASNSETIAGSLVKEALVTTAVSGTVSSSLTLNQSVGASTRDCMLITDGTYTDYFQITGVGGGGTIISFSAAVVLNDYAANGAKVQLLREQDPDAAPALWFDSIDKITRHGVKTILNQIDFSS